jgi:hypothetical protein
VAAAETPGGETAVAQTEGESGEIATMPLAGPDLSNPVERERKLRLLQSQK